MGIPQLSAAGNKRKDKTGNVFCAQLPDRTVFRCKEVLDNTVSVIKNAMSACLIDSDRLVVGTEDGLFCVDLDRDGK